MKVQVRLFGAFSQGLPGYQPAQGIEVDLPEGATVKDLLTLLGVSESQGAVVIAEGRVLKTGDAMQPGVPVNVMQAIGGG
jgi:molybdopterin synthase sulfur carrier subunit